MQGLSIPKISIPKNFLKITHEAVAELIDKKETSYVLIDVRGGDYVGGRILSFLYSLFLLLASSYIHVFVTLIHVHQIL